MVFRERRRNSSLKFWEVPTSEDRDMVTCIFTLAKFYKGMIDEGRYTERCRGNTNNEDDSIVQHPDPQDADLVIFYCDGPALTFPISKFCLMSR